MPDLYNKYTKQQKLTALKTLHENGMAFTKTATDLGIFHDTLRTWAKSDWGKLYLAECSVKSAGEIVTMGLGSIVDAKVGHLQGQFKFFRDLEGLMDVCITRYNELLPTSTKLQDITESFKAIGDLYIKAINATKDNNNYNNAESSKKDFIINLIEKQMVVKPIQLQDLIKE